MVLWPWLSVSGSLALALRLWLSSSGSGSLALAVWLKLSGSSFLAILGCANCCPVWVLNKRSADNKT
eukprot:5845546-Karenia_brevis.AAC.1